jgi:hypothetical protein
VWLALFLIPAVRTIDEVVHDFGFEWVFNVAIPLTAACMTAAALQYGYRRAAKTVVGFSVAGFVIVFALSVAIIPFVIEESVDAGFGILMLVSPFILAVMVLPFSLYIARLWKKMFAMCSRSTCLVLCLIPFLFLAYAWSTSVVTTKQDTKHSSVESSSNNERSEVASNQIVIEDMPLDGQRAVTDGSQYNELDAIHTNKQAGLKIRYLSEYVQVIDVSNTSTKFRTSDGAVLVFELIGELPPHSITEFPSKDLEVQYRLSYLNKGNGWGNFLPYQVGDYVGYLGLYVKPGSTCRHEVFMTEMSDSNWYRFGIEDCGKDPDLDRTTLFTMIAWLEFVR